MPSFEVSITVHQPVDVVVEAMMNPLNTPLWTKHLEWFEVVKGKAGRVGAIGRLHYRENGREYVLEDRLIEVQPGAKYVSRVSGDMLEATVETTLRPVDGSTVMSIRWSGRGTRFPANVMLPFMRRRMKQQSQAELETFRRLLETRGSDFSGTASRSASQ